MPVLQTLQFIAGSFFGAKEALAEQIAPEVRESGYSANQRLPNLLPNVSDLLAGAQRGWITDDEARYWLRQQGVLWPGEIREERPVTRIEALWHAKASDAYFVLPVGQLMVARTRGIMTADEFDLHLRRTGVISRTERSIVDQLRREIPGSSDLIRFAVREAFSPSTVARFSYDEEFPQSFQEWMDKQGFGYEFEITDPVDGKKITTTWPKSYWRAHWDMPSPTQTYQFLHRVRPDNIEEWRAQGFDLQPWTLDDTRTILKIQDYPKGIRDYLAAISYRPFIRRDIGRMYSVGVFKERKEVVAAYLDLGYNNANAEKLTDFTIELDKKQKLGTTNWIRTEKAKTRKSILDGYEIGALARVQAKTFLQGEGAEDVDAETILDGIELKLRVAIVKKAVQAIRRDFLSGALTASEATGNLLTASVENERATQLVRGWQSELNYPRRVAGTTTLMGWLRDGLISPDNARVRLVNLGWSDPDAFLWMSEVSQDLEKRSMQEQMRRARSEEARARAVDAAARKQRTETDYIQAQMREHSSPDRMKRWLKRGSISEETVANRLRFLDWPQDDIDRFLEESRNGSTT